MLCPLALKNLKGLTNKLPRSTHRSCEYGILVGLLSNHNIVMGIIDPYWTLKDIQHHAKKFGMIRNTLTSCEESEHHEESDEYQFTYKKKVKHALT